jgi:hypothetical protein
LPAGSTVKCVSRGNPAEQAIPSRGASVLCANWRRQYPGDIYSNIDRELEPNDSPLFRYPFVRDQAKIGSVVEPRDRSTYSASVNPVDCGINKRAIDIPN